jgi:phosphomannomutase
MLDFSSVLRRYDVRGVYGVDLTLEKIEHLTNIIGSYITKRHDSRLLIIGYDTRTHSKEIFDVVIKAIRSHNVSIINCGLVTTPCLSFFVKKYKSYGIMITASHNHTSFNGLKLFKPDGQSISKQEILNASQELVLKKYETKGSYSEVEVSDYLSFLGSSFSSLFSKKRVAWNFMNGSINRFSSTIINSLSSNNFIINDSVHDLKENPYPEHPDNLSEMKNLIFENRCDVGFAFDGDADRVSVFDNRGRLVVPEHLIMMLSGHMDFSDQKILCDVNLSSKLRDFLNNLDCEMLYSPVGHSFMKEKIVETRAALSAEVSGHYIFQKVGFDDGLFMALTFLQIVESIPDLAKLIDLLPEIFINRNIRVAMAEKDFGSLIEKLKRYAKDNHFKYDLIDGIKIFNEYGWVLIRYSGTESCMVYGFEAYKESDIWKMKSFVGKILY